MDKHDKLKILRQLSLTRGQKAEGALKAELKKVTDRLANESDYSELKQLLEELSVFAFRVHKETINAIRSFLQRMRSSHDSINKANAIFPNRFPAHLHLTRDALDIVERIRYFEMPSALEIFCEYSANEDSALRRRALDGLKKCAVYDIDIYFAGENRAGLKEAPQLQVIEFLESRGVEIAETRLEAMTTLARELLSSTMEGTSWTYDSVNWSTGAIPPTESIKSIRNRTIELLKTKYNLDMDEEERRSIISTMIAATQLPHHGQPEEALLRIIESNTICVLAWLKSILSAESYSTRQKIEHDTYWLFYHAATDAIRKAALEIRDRIFEDPEYDIYRTLIGFESIFDDWEASRANERDFSKIENDRKESARNFIASISDDNWPQWKERIFRYCQTRSNDLATFPHYQDFLNSLAVAHTDFAFELVSDHLEKIQGFTLPLYLGLWESSRKEDLKQLLLRYVSDGRELMAISRLFIRSKDIDKDILQQTLKTVLERPDEHVLSQLVAVAATKYRLDPSFLVGNLLMPAMTQLAEQKSARWVEQIWFVEEFQNLISEFSDEVCDIVLNVLIKVDHIDYQSEQLLKTIAEKNPGAVVEFFGRRIEHEDESSDYEPIPFSFQSLSEPLSYAADILVESVRGWFQEDDSLFMYRGGRLIANVFPDFGEKVEAAMLPLAKSGNANDAFFIMGVLHNYHGEPFMHSICREIVANHHNNKPLMNEVSIALLSTGVVTGEFGLAEAYSRKANEIEYWLKDESAVVREFTEDYRETLKKLEKDERARAEESIALRKHKYGVGKAS